jgi:hypothetical protein
MYTTPMASIVENKISFIYIVIQSDIKIPLAVETIVNPTLVVLQKKKLLIPSPCSVT